MSNLTKRRLLGCALLLSMFVPLLVGSFAYPALESVGHVTDAEVILAGIVGLSIAVVFSMAFAVMFEFHTYWYKRFWKAPMGETPYVVQVQSVTNVDSYLGNSSKDRTFHYANLDKV